MCVFKKQLHNYKSHTLYNCADHIQMHVMHFFILNVFFLLFHQPAVTNHCFVMRKSIHHAGSEICILFFLSVQHYHYLIMWFSHHMDMNGNQWMHGTEPHLHPARVLWEIGVCNDVFLSSGGHDLQLQTFTVLHSTLTVLIHNSFNSKKYNKK